jgi:putative membrane protein
VSIVTYVVGVGLSLIGVFAGALRAAPVDSTGNVLMTAMAFVFESVPWIAVAALTASMGRLLDEAIRNDRVRNSYLNLPFGVLAVGLVVRGFSAYFLQRAGEIPPVVVPRITVGQTTVQQLTLDPRTRLAVYVVLGVLVSLVGVRVASYVSGTAISEELAE